MKKSKTTPEEIVHLIGNIANRQDLREVQERQVKEIKKLIKSNLNERLERLELVVFKLCEDVVDNDHSYGRWYDEMFSFIKDYKNTIKDEEE